MRLPRFVLDPVLRKKIAFSKIDLTRYSVRVARTTADYDGAFRLVHAAYVALGIDDVRQDGMRVVPQHVLPESTVFVAYEGARIVGTMTVVQDSPAGLPLDKEYPEAISRIRESGGTLVEFASLAVVKRCFHTGVTQLLNMAAYHYALARLHATHTVIGVHPRAADLYRAVFGFTMLGEAHVHADLGAEVVGLVLDMEQAQVHGKRHLSTVMQSGETAYFHHVVQPPSCIELPPIGMSPGELARWKLPREVFHELFFDKSDRIATLDPVTYDALSQRRSRATLQADSIDRDIERYLGEMLADSARGAG